MIECLPYVFGGVRLLLGLTLLAMVFEIFGETKQDSLFKRRKGLMLAASIFLVVSGLYTIFFSTGDTYKI